jgi:hypothetical protein
MKQQNINVIGLKPPQGILTGGADIVRRLNQARRLFCLLVA